MRESLLTPSLSSTRTSSVALYSTRSAFLLAFFGGPFAIILYSALNSWKLKRPLDALVYLAALVVSCAFIAALLTGFAPLMAVADMIGRGALSVLLRLLSLALFGVFYLMHAKQHRSAALFGVDAPSPWIPAIACFAIGYGLARAVAYLTGVAVA